MHCIFYIRKHKWKSIEGCVSLTNTFVNKSRGEGNGISRTVIDVVGVEFPLCYVYACQRPKFHSAEMHALLTSSLRVLFTSHYAYLQLDEVGRLINRTCAMFRASGLLSWHADACQWLVIVYEAELGLPVSTSPSWSPSRSVSPERYTRASLYVCESCGRREVAPMLEVECWECYDEHN